MRLENQGLIGESGMPGQAVSSPENWTRVHTGMHGALESCLIVHGLPTAALFTDKIDDGEHNCKHFREVPRIPRLGLVTGKQHIPWACSLFPGERPPTPASPWRNHHQLLCVPNSPQSWGPPKMRAYSTLLNATMLTDRAQRMLWLELQTVGARAGLRGNLV